MTDLHRERRATAARAAGIRVVDGEPRANQFLGKIDHVFIRRRISLLVCIEPVSVVVSSEIFKKFKRSAIQKGKSGYGLGLYYAKMIFQMHGGDLMHMNSEKGTQFTITIPA